VYRDWLYVPETALVKSVVLSRVNRSAFRYFERQDSKLTICVGYCASSS